MNSNPVTYFEIPVQDLERAIQFYSRVFNFSMQKTTIDGLEMAFFPFSKDANGITGALVVGETYQPSKQGALIYFHTDDIEQTLQNAVKEGSKILYPITDNGEWGLVAEFEDSEGNRIGLHQPKL